MQFEALREKLLRAGVAPRHVRRYIRELNEHLADLIAIQHGTGYSGEDAALRARAALGDDDSLARAMISRRGVKSWSARVPWLVFTLLPLLAMLFIASFWFLILVIIGGSHGVFKHGAGPWPEWFSLFAQFMSVTANLLLAPSIALLFLLMAQRQRLPLIWPAVVTLVMLVLFPHVTTQAGIISHFGDFRLGFAWWGKSNHLEIAWTTIFDTRAWQVIAAQWPLVLAQWALTILPLLWLFKMSKAKARVPD